MRKGVKIKTKKAKANIGKQLYDKLLELGDSLPDVRFLIKGEVAIPQRINQRKKIIKLYLSGGKEAVETYVVKVRKEFEMLKQSHPGLFSEPVKSSEHENG